MCPENPAPTLSVAALTIAGSDSGGGAGIQADLKTFAAHRVFGTSVLCAVTAQNTLGVQAAETLPPDLVAQQIQSVLADFPVTSVKTGMLANAANSQAVVEGLTGAVEDGAISLVVDPVMVATAGARLADDDAVEVVRQRLLPLCTLLTPNIPEAERLSGQSIDSPKDMLGAAGRLRREGATAVLLKGGHLDHAEVHDLLLWDGGEQWFRHARRPGRYHGTGCTLSAAICARLARGEALGAAVEGAIDYLQRAMQAARRPLRGDLLVLDAVLESL